MVEGGFAGVHEKMIQNSRLKIQNSKPISTVNGANILNWNNN
jgi:hypothetical protein